MWYVKRMCILLAALAALTLCGCRAKATATPAPTALPATATSAPTAIPPTPTPAAPACPPDARFVADVTIPDDTALAPGETFTKSWLLQNTGTCAWPNEAYLTFSEGEQMGLETSVPVPPISAGQTVTVSVSMTAPTTPGTHEGRWQLCYGGECYGSKVWVRIVTVAP